MVGKRQFSLGYLLLEILCISVAIGATRQLLIYQKLPYLFPDEWGIGVIAFLADVVAIPAAIGGLFGEMRSGALSGLALLAAGVVLGLLSGLFLPAVQ